MRRSLLVAAAAAALCCWSALAVSGPVTCDTTPDEQAKFAKVAVGVLADAGWTVELGQFKFLKNTTTFGANPSSVYGVFEAPHTDDLVPEYWVSEADAVLWIGCTPSDLLYFSFRSYVFDMRDPFANVFASLGDSANNLVFNTTTTRSAPLNSTAALVSAADATTFAAVDAALTAAGFDEAAVNHDVIPSSLLTMSRDPLAGDSIVMLARVAQFTDAAVGAAYKDSVWPVYYLRAPNATASAPLPVPALRKRGTGHTEAHLQESLDALANALRAHQKQHETFSSIAKQVDIDGFHCIEAYHEHLHNGTECAGDNHDTTYGAAPDRVYLNQSVAWVVGVNHAAVGKATYSNFDVNTFNAFGLPQGLEAVSNKHFHGSARVWLPSDPNADLLFAYKVARTCDAHDLFCLAVPVTEKLKADAPIVVATRAYLEPPTKTGPLWDELLPAVVMAFPM